MLTRYIAVALGTLYASMLCGALARGQDYDKAASEASKGMKPLVVFIGVDARPIAPAIVCRVQKLPGYNGPAIVVSVPGGDWLLWRATLPATATDAEILSAISLPAGATDAMDELNAQRVRRGLFPFLRDHGLTLAAARAAKHRADHGISGHVPGQMGDFAFLPAGTHADCAGCAAWEPWLVTTTGETFGACASDSTEHRFAGAAWVMGSNGVRYSHVFYRR